MKRDFLKDLGIEDKDIIDKIMNENSADIGKAKGDLADYKQQVTTLNANLATANAKISKLESNAGNVEQLTSQIEKLKGEKLELETSSNAKLSQLKKTYAVENSVRDSGARSVKAVMAYIDMAKVDYENESLSGLSEQVDALKKDNSTSFLFGTTAPSGTTPNGGSNPNGQTPPSGKTLSEAVAAAFSKPN